MKTRMCPFFFIALVSSCLCILAADTKVNAGECNQQRGVVYLEKSRNWNLWAGGHGHKCVLARELLRQALLLAARDELGLSTRDAWLGDSMPAKGDNAPWNLSAEAAKGTPIEILRGFPPSSKSLFQYDLDLTGDLNYATLLVEAERLSRTKFVEVLRKAGFEGKASRATSNAAVSETVARLLAEMTFTAQFQAVRELHEAIRERGESPALLGALVRGYTNLGLLTEFHWHPAHKVFKARALLYAQRMVASEGSPVWAKWHRAYALALIGLHNLAMEDMDDAEADLRTAPVDGRASRPAWLGLIKAYCHYDLKALSEREAASTDAQLAFLLAYCSAEMANESQIAAVEAKQLLQAMPECYRVYEGLYASDDLGDMRSCAFAAPQVLGRTLYTRLAAMSGLPENVRVIMKLRSRATGFSRTILGGPEESPETEYKIRVQLSNALLTAERPGGGKSVRQPLADGAMLDHQLGDDGLIDGGEPSWSVLGHLIRELSFVQVWRQVRFLRAGLSVPAEEVLASCAPLVAEHPYRSFIDSHTVDVARRRKALQELSAVDMEGLELPGRYMPDEIAEYDRNRWNQIAATLQPRADEVARDLVVQALAISHLRIRIARRLLEVSPASPYAKAILVERDWQNVRPQAAAWEKDAGQHPVLLRALGERYAEAGEFAAAERCFAAAAQIFPDASIHMALAEVYRKHGQEDKWLATMEEVLKLPDRGLTHGLVCDKIAKHFIGRKEWNKAIKWAKTAADTGSGWGLMRAAGCYEGMQEWGEAEEYYRAASLRYAGCRTEWYLFCRRTGHGNIEPARQMANRCIEHIDPRAADRQTVEHYNLYAWAYYLLERRFEKAMECVEEDFARTNNPFYGLHLALLADRLNDVKKRDAAFQQIRAKGGTYMRIATGKPRKELISLANLLSQDLAQGGKGVIDLEAADRLCATADGADQMNFNYFLAAYLDLHGKPDKAIEYWKRCMGFTEVMADHNRILAGAALVHRGLKPEDYRTVFQKADDNSEKGSLRK